MLLFTLVCPEKERLRFGLNFCSWDDDIDYFFLKLHHHTKKKLLKYPFASKVLKRTSFVLSNLGFFEIPYLGWGTAFYTCFSRNVHFSFVTTTLEPNCLFLGLSRLLASQRSVPYMSCLWN